MSTALARTNGAVEYIQPSSAPSRYDDPGIVQTLKNTVAKGATDSEFQMFIEICKSSGLNPFLKEIWCAVPMKDGQRSQYGQVLIMAGRDGYLRVANDHPMFDGIETRVERDPKGIPVKAVCTVWRKDRNHPTICEAYFNEYYKPGYNGKPSVWDTYKSAMIGKVAEVLALKRSFSINGVVTEEEIGSQPTFDAPIDTGGHPMNTQAAADHVAQRKIEELKQQQAQRAQQPAPLRTAEQIPADVQNMWARMADIKSTLTVFTNLKQSMVDCMSEAPGERAYYEILGKQGVKHANEFKSTRPARTAAREMLETIRAYQEPPAEDPLHVTEADAEQIQ